MQTSQLLGNGYADRAVPAEVVLAGAASVLGKIGTVPAAIELFVRCPCVTQLPGAGRALWRVSCDKAHAIRFFLARTILDAPTITFASVAASDTVVINGLTFTAHANTTTLSTRTFSIGADEDAAAVQLALCINAATYGVPGVTAVAALHVVTVTAVTATTVHSVTGVGGARVVCASTILTTLAQQGATIAGLAANNTLAGIIYEQWVNGYPHAYIGVTNNDASNAATMVVGATLLP